jgi:hypothetical protein
MVILGPFDWVHWVLSIVEPGGNSSMISRARVHARARKAVSVRKRSPRLRLRTLWLWLRSYGSALRLRGSSIRLRSYGPALQLRSSSLCGTDHGRNDHCYRDASSGLHSGTGGVRVL